MDVLRHVPATLGRRARKRDTGVEPVGGRRHRRTVAALATLTLAVAAATAQAYAPPRGTPDLSKMTLQSGDLARGAQVFASGYFPPGSGIGLQAQYNRYFGACATSAGVRFSQIQTSIELAKTPAYAKVIFAQLPSIFGAQSGRSILTTQVAPLAGKGAGATPKDPSFGKLRAVGAGQQSLLESGTFVVDGAKVAADFAWVRVDGVIADLTFVAAGPTLADSVAITLTRTVAAHMSAVLGAAS